MGKPLIQHEVYEHTGDTDIHPQRPGPACDGAMLIIAVSYTHLDVYKRQALFLGECAHLVDEFECAREVWKLELASDVMLVDDAPLGNDLVKRLKRLALEGRHSAATGNAFLIGQLFGHKYSPPAMIVQVMG